MSVLSQPTPQISVGPPPTLTYQVSVTNGQAYTLTVFQTLNGTNTVVVSPTSYTGTGSLQTYTFTSPVTSYSYYTSVLIGVTTTNSPSVLYYSPYQGPQGVQGNPGTVGGQGPIGPVGPQGPQGLQGVVSVTNYVTCNSLITSGTSSGTVNANANLTFNGTILDVIGQQRVTNVGGNILTISNSQSLTSNTLTTPNTLSSIVLCNAGTGATGSNFYNTSMLFNVGGYGGSIGGGLQNNVGAFLSLGTMVFNGAINPILNIVSSTTTNGNVGIGTTAPAYTLDVKGSANVSNAYYVNGALQSTTYTLADTVTVAQYIFIGTWTTAQAGRKLLITLTSSQGYNSSPTQQQVTRLCMNTANGSSVINGTSGGLVYFSAAAYIDTPLGGATGSPSTFRIVQVSSAYGSTVLAVYGNFSAYIGSAFYTVSVSGGDSWTNSSTLYGVTGPTGTYLDVTPSVSPTISGSNYGFGTTAPAYTLDVNGTIRGTLVGNISTSTQATFQSHATGGIWYYTTDGSPRLRFVSGSTSSSTLADSNSIIFQTPANTTMANITSTGMRVGDGTAASYMLDVNGSINSTGSIYVRGTNYLITYGGTSGYTYMNTDSNGYGYMRAAGSYLFMGAGGTSTLAVTNNAMSINTGAGPNYTLDVGGQVRIYETTGTNVVAGTANTMPTTAIAGKTSGSLTLYHNNANGHSSILFPSKTNDGGDYGYITFMDDVSNRAGSEECRLLIGCDNDYATDHVILQPFGGRVGVGQMLPAYKFDMFGGSANFSFNGTYGTVFVGSSDGLLIQGYSYGSSYIRADCNAANGISTNALFLGTGGCNVVDITRTDVQCHPTNALYVRNDKGAGNFVVEGTSYLGDIYNTNVYATSAIVSGTTAGRLLMLGATNACYIEAGLNSDTGSAAPLYFTDMNNANQWMCIGSTGNVGINNNSPVGRFHVKTSGNALDTFLGWDSTWMVVTPAANAATAKNTPGLGLGYSVASNTAYVTALAPNDKWKNLNLDGSNINLSPHDGGVNVNGSLSVFGGSHYIRGLTQVVADGGSVVATTPSGAATYPTNAFCVKAQTRLPDTTYSISNVFSVTTYVYSTSYTSNSIFMAINPTHYMIVTAWQDNGNWFSGSLLYTHLGGYSNAGSFVGNLSIGGAGAGIKFTNMTSGSGFRCTMIAVSAGMS